LSRCNIAEYEKKAWAILNHNLRNELKSTVNKRSNELKSEIKIAITYL